VDFGDNVWDVDFDPPDEWSEAAEKAGFGAVQGKRLPRQPGATLSAEVIEYPDGGKIASMARTETTGGGPLFSLNRLADAVDYFEGESP
jgi:hypothetical protein